MEYINLLKTTLLYFCLNGDAISSELIFSCNTTSGKQIRLEKENSHVIYSYGKPNAQPEMVLKKKIKSLQRKLSAPEGSNIVTSIYLTNGDYTYEIFTSTDRMNPTHKSHSGIFVLKGSELIRRIRCTNESLKENLLNINHDD